MLGLTSGAQMLCLIAFFRWRWKVAAELPYETGSSALQFVRSYDAQRDSAFVLCLECMIPYIFIVKKEEKRKKKPRTFLVWVTDYLL